MTDADESPRTTLRMPTTGTGAALPTAREGHEAHARGRIGGTARGWPGLGRLLADCWSGAVPHEVAELWAGAQEDQRLPLAIRARAAAAFEPFR